MNLLNNFKITLLILIFAPVLCFAGLSSNEQNIQSEQPASVKAATLHQEAQNWIIVGNTQMKKGYYQEAEKSFLSAMEYQDYLSPAEKNKLQESLEKAHKAAIEGQDVAAHLKQAKAFLNQGQPVKARAEYEKIRNDPALTEQQRKEISQDLKKIDAGFDKQRNEIIDLYNRSVEYYRQGDLEKAREGFSQIAKSGVLIAPKGQTAEDYLVQIDSILTERLSNQTKAGKSMKVEPQSVPQQVNPVVPQESINQTKAAKESKQPEAQTPQQEEKEIESAAAEAPVEKKSQTESKEEARVKVISEYTKAVVDAAPAKAQKFIDQNDFSMALDCVRAAAETVGENRNIIGEDIFKQYTAELRLLAEKVVASQKGKR